MVRCTSDGTNGGGGYSSTAQLSDLNPRRGNILNGFAGVEIY